MSDGVLTNIPADFSTGGLTLEDRGYKQQTFLGASIRSFNMKAGFGDESSTLSIELVEDEYNKSDGTPQGEGADVYHNGKHDKFVPPFIGSPVFFTFGKDYADVAKAYQGVFDYTYSGVSTSSGVTIEDGSYSGPISGVDRSSFADNEYYDAENEKSVLVVDDANIGRDHLTFGGILHSFVETTSTQGNKLYSAKVSDPREILDSVKIILNDFTGSVGGTDNIFNIYGFLEHNAKSDTVSGLGTPDPVVRKVDKDSKITYEGTDTYISRESEEGEEGGTTDYVGFPITGTGFSRRSDRGIPYYRVAQGVNWLIGNTDDLPQEYLDMKFGDKINFRGLKYIVDLSGLPAMPDFYSLDFDSMSLLDLCLEICDISNTDLYVTLLPIIDNENTRIPFNKNKNADNEDLVVGMIRVDAIDRKEQPSLGAVKEYLSELDSKEIYVKNSDTGYELANITTDKLVLGAQESTMHFFSADSDKDKVPVARYEMNGGGGDESKIRDAVGNSWSLENACTQQIIPFYGTLDGHCVSLPRGWGAYQQILLDSSHVAAKGVGNYYVATEMELRCAIAGFEKWMSFLMKYNKLYFEKCDPADIKGGGKDKNNKGIDPNQGEGDPQLPDDESQYACTVPRSVFPHYGNNGIDEDAETHLECNPPMGWPLYWRRATNLGIPLSNQAFIDQIWQTYIDPIVDQLKELIDGVEENNVLFKIPGLRQTWDAFTNTVDKVDSVGNETYNKVVNYLSDLYQKAKDGGVQGDFIEEITNMINEERIAMGKAFKQGERNARIVHSFLQEIAQECLGKKYLVKLPKTVNVNWSRVVRTEGSGVPFIFEGPFGFMPQPRASAEDVGVSGLPYSYNKEFVDKYKKIDPVKKDSDEDAIDKFLKSNPNANAADLLGALDSNYNPFADKFEFNYYPETEGGFFPPDIYKELLSEDQVITLKEEKAKKKDGFSGLSAQLVPSDIARFINENNRVSAYVRYNNSHEIDMSSLNVDDFVQEKITPESKISDVSQSLDNVHPVSSTDLFSYPQPVNPDEKQIAYVKCTVDPKLYYLPRIDNSGQVKIENGYERYSVYVQPSVEEENGEEVTKIVNSTTAFRPVAGTTAEQTMPEFATVTKTNGVVIDTSAALKIKTDDNKTSSNRELEHVYVLITLPARLEPTVDKRYRDGVFQQINPDVTKHLLAMDVVKGFKPLEAVPYVDAPLVYNKDGKASDAPIEAQRKGKPLEFGLPNYIAHLVPSVAEPDLAVIPLISTERCYGPWNSQILDTRNEEEKKKGEEIKPRYIELGGPVDFIKEENIAPWNYAGYKGMNEAGKLQAEFANNLLLLSERGSFSYADAPQNVYLAEELKERGPLVTNINVSIGPRGIVTNIDLDLYTVGFGKLQKHRQQKLQETAREKLKVRDEKNIRIRKNVGKKQKNEDYNALYKKMERDVRSLVKDMEKQNQTVKVATSQSNLIGTNAKQKLSGKNLNTQEDTTVSKKSTSASTQAHDTAGKAMGEFPDFISSSSSYSRSAGGSLTDLFIPMSNEPEHGHMPSVPDPQLEAKKNLYPEITLADVTEDDLSEFEA